MSASACFARFMVRLSVIVMANFSLLSKRLRRDRYISVSSTERTCRVLINEASWVTGQKATSSRFEGRLTSADLLTFIGRRTASNFIPATIGLNLRQDATLFARGILRIRSQRARLSF